MIKLYLSYNPYRVETELRLMTGDKLTVVSEESALMWMARMRMQRWLSEDCPRNFFDELKNNLGDEEIEILFSGTVEDMEDLINAANRYMKTHKESCISVSSVDEQGPESGTRQKISQLKELLREAKASPYHEVIPQKIWQEIKGMENSEEAQVIRMNLETWQQESEKLMIGENWHQVCLHFQLAAIDSRAMREAFRAFSKEISKGVNREWERERFILICECTEAVLRDIVRTQDMVKKVLLEYGICDLNVYLVYEEESELLYVPDAKNVSSQLRDARKAMELYSNYYAGQYRLRQKCVELQESLKQEGLVRGKELFRKVEKIMRSHEDFPMVHDKQIFEAHEWILNFLGALENWLNIDIS